MWTMNNAFNIDQIVQGVETNIKYLCLNRSWYDTVVLLVTLALMQTVFFWLSTEIRYEKLAHARN